MNRSPTNAVKNMKPGGMEKQVERKNESMQCSWNIMPCQRTAVGSSKITSRETSNRLSVGFIGPNIRMM